ncbi:hypothetical protein C8J57DRAFT_1268900 [Mycena rebaudengoi]|nr:hypothetical protein C8J57DRAFT_1268900 [Mycena rebaudengoi]
MLEVLVHRSFFPRSFLLITFFFTLCTNVLAGQTFTNGLTVIDSPSPDNPGRAGSNINIAVDVSGNGKLPPAASFPGSGLPTSYEYLEIYLVSSQTNINMTVVSGPEFLTGESGSTVKHLNWPIPSCIPAGLYNLTFYESSRFNGQGLFTITAIPLPISNSDPSGECTNLNTLQPQPQASAPLSESPFAPGSTLSTTNSRGGMVTIIGPPGGSVGPVMTLTLTLSDGQLDIPTATVTVTAKPITTTMVVLSTVTQTEEGQAVTYVQTATVTTVIPAPTGQSDTTDTSGFSPVNAAPRLMHPTLPLMFLGAWMLYFLFSV